MLDTFIYFIGAVSLIVGIGILAFILTLVLFMISVAGLMTILGYISARRRGMKRKDYYSSPWKLFIFSLDIYDPFSKIGILTILHDIKSYCHQIRYPVPFISKEDDFKRIRNEIKIIRHSIEP